MLWVFQLVAFLKLPISYLDPYGIFTAGRAYGRAPVTEETIKFHLVPDMKMRFHKFVKGIWLYSYLAQLGAWRARQNQQDAAQKAYLDKQAAKKGGPSTNAASASTSKVSQGLSTKPHNTLKRTANQALEEFNVATEKGLYQLHLMIQDCEEILFEANLK
ncbi:hypothetical protein F5876DRAFT_62844 [Lentinula aff. lateritia]|uniref:Uncharacterized protein n=1 Tax=Lentinula aff. lateritia TaxID=2804960 RepID=A0ACC1UAJ7_9AGAR|nr:hypothetical protein F5876DRAFT_62844 [Lentinula aff. lateritia]